MSRLPDRYEREALDVMTGPEGSLIRVIPSGASYNYEGILLARVLTPERHLDAFVIELRAAAGRISEPPYLPVTIRWAAVESLIVLNLNPDNEEPS